MTTQLKHVIFLEVLMHPCIFLLERITMFKTVAAPRVNKPAALDITETEPWVNLPIFWTSKVSPREQRRQKTSAKPWAKWKSTHLCGLLDFFSGRRGNFIALCRTRDTVLDTGKGGAHSSLYNFAAEFQLLADQHLLLASLNFSLEPHCHYDRTGELQEKYMQKYAICKYIFRKLISLVETLPEDDIKSIRCFHILCSSTVRASTAIYA